MNSWRLMFIAVLAMSMSVHDVTVDDPKAYTQPWTTKLTQLIVLDTELLDYHCLDNEKDAPHMVGK